SDAAKLVRTRRRRASSRPMGAAACAKAPITATRSAAADSATARRALRGAGTARPAVIGWLSARLRVVLLPVDVAARATLVAPDLRALGRRDDAVGLREALLRADAAMLGAQPGGFAMRQLARLDALLDASLLVLLALGDAGRG